MCAAGSTRTQKKLQPSAEIGGIRLICQRMPSAITQGASTNVPLGREAMYAAKAR